MARDRLRFLPPDPSPVWRAVHWISALGVGAIFLGGIALHVWAALK